MSRQIRLDTEQERAIVMARLCGVSYENLIGHFKTSFRTVKTILGSAGELFSDLSIDDMGRRYESSNAALFYLVSNGREVERSHHLDAKRDHVAYEVVNESRFLPRIERLGKDLGLRTYLEPQTPMERLLRSTLGKRTPERIAKPSLLDIMQMMYNVGEEFDLKQAFERLREEVLVPTIKVGGIAIDEEETPSKALLVDTVLQTLPEGDREILELCHGLRSETRKGLSLSEVGRLLGVECTKASNLHAGAINRLRKSPLVDRLESVYGLMLDSEARNILSQIQVEDERERWRQELYPEIEKEVLATTSTNLLRQVANRRGQGIDPEHGSMSVTELDLPVRPVRILDREGVNTVAELVSKTQRDLLNMREMGRRSVTEIREVLRHMGLELRKEPPST